MTLSDKQPLEDDLDIDDLLLAVATKTRSRTEHAFNSDPAPSWDYIPITYHCLQCKRQYQGKLFHPSNDAFAKAGDIKETPWCPRCLDERLWWLHQGFTVEKVVELG